MMDESELTAEEPGSLDLEPSASLSEKGILFLVLALVIGLDQLTKRLVEGQLALNESWAPFPDIAGFFKFTHVGNTGAAFGLFKDGGDIFTVIAIIVAVVIVGYNFQLSGNQHLFRLALGLQLGGALGNLVDRIRQGHVTDFLDFGPWPVFNLADMSIVAGVIILTLLMFKEQREMSKMENVSANQPSATMTDKSSKSGDAGMLWND